ncbi:MAG: penicillin-binding transpeptidase domain-containing protein [Defluviitaleaceae bacterium]|nr:penicillin-binding transpeptidase domain-containing protein [Defluviitaleaceae bacterium]
MRNRGIKILCGLVCVASVVLIIVMLRSSWPGTTGGLESATVYADEPTLPMPVEEVLKLFFAHAENGRFGEMYDKITEISRRQITRVDFIERNRNIYQGIGARDFIVSDVRVHEVYDRPGRRIVDYTLQISTVAGYIIHDHQAVFELDASGEYRKHWSSATIFPELGENDRVRVIILPAQRGNIYDRHGQMLAGPGPASQVGFVPGRMREDAYDVAEDIERIAALLEMTPENIIRRLGASYVREDTFVLLRTISRDAQELIDELLTVQGIMVSTTTVRYYPLGRAAAHLVGYIQNINAEELELLRDYGYHMNSVIGRTGLESIYESRLRARDGREIFIIDSAGNRGITLARRSPVDGENLYLTIDTEIQLQLYETFAGDMSASVAMNPQTGEVLALVSTPSYDPNYFVRGLTQSQWDAIIENENLPLLNRFRSTFSPGSTMKAITAAIGVDAGIIDPLEDFGRHMRWQQDSSWGGFFVTTVTDYSGPANLNNAMAWSDNIYFAQAALRIGADAFAAGLRDFGFGARIPFEYGMFSSSISRTGGFTSDIQLADSGYGQGEILINPLHMAVIYAAFVNDGNILEPRLIYSGQNTSHWLPNAFSPETAQTVLDSLIFSVEYGTGRPARIPGRTLAGKTGTAELKDAQGDDTGRELGWFVLLTADETAENPLLVVSMVEDVQGRGGSGYVVPKVAGLFG